MKKNKKINKIFIIGFNKCATRSIHSFFKGNKIKSYHVGDDWKRFGDKVELNRANGRRLLSGYDDYTVFSDASLFVKEFKELDIQYPGSKFILNTRDKLDWLASRLNHGRPNKNSSYVKFLNNKNNELLPWFNWVSRWSKEWDEHHNNVYEYFKNRPQDFLKFNIKDNPNIIKRFLKDFYNLNIKLFPRKGATSRSERYFAIRVNADGRRVLRQIKDNYSIK